MKVLFVLKSLRADGGVETSVATVARELKNLGHDVYFAAFCNEDGCRLRYKDEFQKESFIYLGPIRHSFAALRAVPRLHRLIREHKIDIVHSHLFHPGLAGRLAAQFTPAKTVATEDSFRFHWWSRFHFFVDRLLAQRTDALTAVSASTSHTLSTRTRSAVESIVVIPNAVDTAEFTPKTKEREEVLQILVAGRFEYPKNHDYALSICQELKARGLAFRMTFYGEGSLRQQVMDKIKALDLGGYIDVRPPTNKFASALQASDVLLVPSRWEGLPMVILEAFATKTLVVATNVPGNRDLIDDEKNGILIDLGQPIAAADKMDKVFARDPSYYEMSDVAYANLDSYTPKAVAEMYVSLYDTIMSK